MWTNIPKPNTSNYSTVNPPGREEYDQGDLTYDDSSVFYDGNNPNQWTDVIRTNTALGSLQWQQLTIAWQDANEPWNSVNSWTNISKPT